MGFEYFQRTNLLRALTFYGDEQLDILVDGSPF